VVGLDELLLQEAKESRDRVIELEYEADRARLSYQHAIRKLHARGGSLREIADALGLSHQRVHQIVEGVEGKVALKRARDEISCSFCGLLRSEVERVVAGPDVFICDRCIGLASDVVRLGELQSNERAVLTVDSNPTSSCSFCGKRGRPAHRMAVSGDARICDDCLGLCREILTKERSR
jgi:hypothetical protein